MDFCSLLDKWEKIKEFQDCRIVYAFGKEQVPIDASIACNFIAMDENGDFLYDDNGRLLQDNEKIEEFVDFLADEYDTVGKIRQFETTKGDVVPVEGGIYGNRIDRKEFLPDGILCLFLIEDTGSFIYQ